MTSKYVPMIRELMQKNPTIRLWDCVEGDSFDHGLEIPDSIKKVVDYPNEFNIWIELCQLYVVDDEIEDMNTIKMFSTNHSYKDVYDTLKKYLLMR
tara:strand:- start:1176 stop:1463 length:288 start_codon:yes stop_codon:yes gene_type:complete